MPLKKKAREGGEVDGVKEALAQVQKQFNQYQVRPPHRPLGDNGKPLNPILPTDLTRLNDVQLGRLQSEFACMAIYAKLHLAVRAIEHAAAKRAERLAKAKIRLEKSGTVDDKNAKVEVDPRVRAASFISLVREGGEVMTTALLESYVIGREACSREQTRRQRVFGSS